MYITAETNDLLVSVYNENGVRQSIATYVYVDNGMQFTRPT